MNLGLRRCAARHHSVAAAAVAFALVALLVSSPSAGAASSATPGAGLATVLPVTVLSPATTSLQFTFTATTSMTSGVVSVVVPAGWTPPTTSNTVASTGTVSTAGSTITVSGVTLSTFESLTVTYGTGSTLVTTPLAGGYDTFDVSMRPTSSSPLSPLASSPEVFVYAKASPSVLAAVTAVPLAVFNKVGISSPAVTVTPPSIVRHQKPLFTVLDGKKVPASFFWGADFCPFCAPTSWGIIVALGRFGTFNQLYESASSPEEYAPNTPSFTFRLSTYTSSYLTFGGYEVEGPFNEPLQATPTPIQKLVNAYNPNGDFPFLDVGNLAFVNASQFDPYALAGLSQTTIANNLTVPSNPVTRAIIAEANYLSASICAQDGEKPVSVCVSVGVKRADTALGLRQP